MPKSTTGSNVPGLSPSSAKTAEHIIRLLDKSRAVTSMHTYEHFRRTLNIWYAALNLVKMRPWLDACAGMERGLDPLQEALGLLMAEAVSNYNDVIGSVYMLLSQGDKRLGQYFTPFHLARMMAEMSFGDLRPREPGEPPLTMLEPAVGSGVMILAYAEAIEQRYPGMILRGEVLFYGVDRDPLCVTMCNINMLLHRIGHLVRLSDAPGENEHAPVDGAEAHTPHFVFQPARIVQGDSLAQDTATLFAQETPWIPVDVVILPAEADAIPSEASGTDAPQNEGAIQYTPEATEVTEQHLVPDEGEAASIEEFASDGDARGAITEPDGTLAEMPDTPGEQVTTDVGQEAAEASPTTEKHGHEQPALLQVAADETHASENASEQDETVPEVAVRAASEGLPTDQGESGTWQEVRLAQSGSRRKPRGKDTIDAVQPDLFSLSS